MNVQKFPFASSKFSKWWNVRSQETGERRRMFLKSTYSFFFSFLFFLLWSSSGTSREVVSALNSRADVTSLLVIVSTFFLVSVFVFSNLVHRKPEYLSLSTGSKFATPKSFQFWRDCFPLDTLLFIVFLFFWFLTGWMWGALCVATRFIHFVCGSRRVSIRLEVLLLIPKSPHIFITQNPCQKIHGEKKVSFNLVYKEKSHIFKKFPWLDD